MQSKKNYWGYRIDNNARDYFKTELANGRLRQGWGSDVSQDLRNDPSAPDVRKNLPIYRSVKKGDILLIPRIPEWNSITIAEATEDFDKGYLFQIEDNMGDYGHIFPARSLMYINRYDEEVSSAILSSFHVRRRFWSVNSCANDIETILYPSKSVNLFSYATKELSTDAFYVGFSAC